jgi:hypothetical protein
MISKFVSRIFYFFLSSNRAKTEKATRIPCKRRFLLSICSVLIPTLGALSRALLPFCFSGKADSEIEAHGEGSSGV